MGSTEKIEHDDSDTPDIDFAIVVLPCEYLRSHVDGCTAVGCQHFVRNDFAYAEIC